MSNEPDDWTEHDQQQYMAWHEHRHQAAMAFLKSSLETSPNRIIEAHAMIAAAGAKAFMNAMNELDEVSNDA